MTIFVKIFKKNGVLVLLRTKFQKILHVKVASEDPKVKQFYSVSFDG